MSEYGTDNGGYGVDDYGSPEVTLPAGTPLTPQVIPRTEIPVMPLPTRVKQAARPARALAGLGDFSRAGVCSVLALSRILWRFFNEVATGTTIQSLGTLNVYRAAYNAHRGSFISGFSPAAQALLPPAITAAEWSTPVRQSAAIILSGALGNGHPALAALSSMPPAISGITAWLTSFRNALDPGDLESIRTYLEVPTIVGTQPDVTLARAVVDDLRQCGLVPPSASSTPPPPPAIPPRVNPGPTSAPSGGGRSGAGAGGPSVITQTSLPVGNGIWSVLTVGLVGVVGYGLWLSVNEKPSSPKASGLGRYTHPELVEKAKKAAKYDAGKMRCFAGLEERTTTSMDEWSGPRGHALSRALAKIPAADANSIESVYVEELGKLQPKVCPRS